MSRVVALVVALLVATPVVGAALAAPATAGVADGPNAPSTVDAGAAQDDATIQKRIRLFLTPEEPGEIDVEVTYEVPDEVTSLRVSVPEDAREVESAAFTKTNGRYEWDGETEPAALSFSLPANQSASGARAASVAQEGEYSFVDTGPWAVVTVPGLQTGWEWRSTSEDFSVDLAETVRVAGEGSTGGEVAYLGPMERYERTASGQNFTLVVPERASLAASPDEILDALAAAANRLHVGERDDDVWFVAAPADADWGVRGVEYGGNDAWVVADSPLDEAGNVWFHEYVHTRQAFTTATTGRWVTEAAAEYYSTLLALRTDYVDFEAFETYLSYGEREPWRSAVLSRPSTWSGGANYVKGALVWGAVDRRVRLATNSTYTTADVFYRLNQQEEDVSNADVLRAVDEVATQRVVEYAQRYTETREAPSMWTRAEHAEAFGTTPPRMTYEGVEYSVEGPFRNRSFSSPPTLYVGETVRVTARVTNEGGQTGEYGASVTLDGRVLAEASGELAPGDSARLALEQGATEAGTYEVTVGRTTTDVTVREPASVEVDSLSVSPENPQTGDEVSVTLGLSNPTADYATGTVDVTLDGEVVASVTATLEPGASTTRTVSVQMASGGSHALAAGGKTVELSVGMSDGDAGTGTGTPGFGLFAALAALAVVAALATRD